MSGENHHWVPKFLVKNFADTDGRVFCLNVQTDKNTKLPPRHAASSARFNDFLIEGATVSYEDQLERIETAVAPILKQMVSSRSVAGLSDEQRDRVGNFIAAQSFRTQAFHKGLEPTLSRHDFGHIFAELWRGAFLLSADIVRRKWLVMSIDHDDVFYLGDHPVVLQHTGNSKEKKELGFDIEGVEAFLPLSPICALYMPCVSTSQEKIKQYETALTVPEHLAQLQGLGTSSTLLQLSERVIRQSHPLYQALTTGAPFVAGPPIVENLNYLQCMWAHSFVYSDRREFTFARRVFRENPQYRSTVKVRLGTIGAA